MDELREEAERIQAELAVAERDFSGNFTSTPGRFQGFRRVSKEG
ncbi:hypothetical protein AB0L56_12510 [Streptomyces sp. NPDC052079]